MQECPEIKGGGRERGEKRSDENGKRKEKKRGQERGRVERKKDGKFLWLAALPADPYRRNVLIGYNVATREGVITKI